MTRSGAVFALAALTVALVLGLWLWTRGEIERTERSAVTTRSTGGSGSDPTGESPTALQPDSTPSSAATLDSESAQVVEAPKNDPQLVPLEDLLRVPQASAFPHLDPEDDAKPDLAVEIEGPTQARRSLRIDASSRRDMLEEDPEQTRQQVDAGASVEVDENTRIRGGVRIERDPESAVTKEEETAPMIGVEKRF